MKLQLSNLKKIIQESLQSRHFVYVKGPKVRGGHVHWIKHMPSGKIVPSSMLHPKLGIRDAKKLTAILNQLDLPDLEETELSSESLMMIRDAVMNSDYANPSMGF